MSVLQFCQAAHLYFAVVSFVLSNAESCYVSILQHVRLHDMPLVEWSGMANVLMLLYLMHPQQQPFFNTWFIIQLILLAVINLDGRISTLSHAKDTWVIMAVAWNRCLIYFTTSALSVSSKTILMLQRQFADTFFSVCGTFATSSYFYGFVSHYNLFECVFMAICSHKYPYQDIQGVALIMQTYVFKGYTLD